jgi:hypothetical protein
MGAKYYVVHQGSETVFELDECKLVVVNDDNEEAQEALDNGEVREILHYANAVYSDNEITLG